MEYFVQQLINGIALGSIYGLIAIGYTMVYGIIGMINFAHGDIFMIGAFIALIAFLMLVSIGVTAIPLILLIVLLIAMAITALYGWTVERIAYRPLRHSFRLAPLISAIGMSIVLQNYVAGRAGRAREAAAAARHRRLHAARGRRASSCSSPTCRSSWSSTTLVLLALFTWLVSQHAARPRHARLRAGPEDGLAARRRHRPHHLA